LRGHDVWRARAPAVFPPSRAFFGPCPCPAQRRHRLRRRGRQRQTGGWARGGECPATGEQREPARQREPEQQQPAPPHGIERQPTPVRRTGPLRVVLDPAPRPRGPRGERWWRQRRGERRGERLRWGDQCVLNERARRRQQGPEHEPVGRLGAPTDKRHTPPPAPQPPTPKRRP
jgi:hypothetical protein